MKKTEQEYVEAARDALRESEAEWRKAIEMARGVIAVNAEKGDARLANEALGAVAQLTDQLGEMLYCHKRVTDILLENWPDFGADVVTRGPGR